METGRQLANLVAKFGLYYESDRTQLVRLFYDMADQAHEDCDNVTLSHKREAKQTGQAKLCTTELSVVPALAMLVKGQNAQEQKKAADVFYKLLKKEYKGNSGGAVMTASTVALGVLGTAYAYSLLDKFLTQNTIPSKMGDLFVALGAPGKTVAQEGARLSNQEQGRNAYYLNRFNESFQYIDQKEAKRQGWQTTVESAGRQYPQGNLFEDIGVMLAEQSVSNVNAHALASRLVSLANDYAGDQKEAASDIHYPVIVGILEGYRTQKRFTNEPSKALLHLLYNGDWVDINEGTQRRVHQKAYLFAKTTGKNFGWKEPVYDKLKEERYRKYENAVAVGQMVDVVYTAAMFGLLASDIAGIVRHFVLRAGWVGEANVQALVRRTDMPLNKVAVRGPAPTLPAARPAAKLVPAAPAAAAAVAPVAKPTVPVAPAAQAAPAAAARTYNPAYVQPQMPAAAAKPVAVEGNTGSLREAYQAHGKGFAPNRLAAERAYNHPEGAELVGQTANAAPAAANYEIKVTLPGGEKKIIVAPGAKTPEEAQKIAELLDFMYEKYEAERISRETFMELYDRVAAQGASLQELETAAGVPHDGFKIRVSRQWEDLRLIVAAKTPQEAQEIARLLGILNVQQKAGIIPERTFMAIYNRAEQGASLQELETAAGVPHDGIEIRVDGMIGGYNVGFIVAAKTWQEAQKMRQLLKLLPRQQKAGLFSEEKLQELYHLATHGASWQELATAAGVPPAGFKISVHIPVEEGRWKQLDLMIAAKTPQEAEKMEQLFDTMYEKYEAKRISEETLLEFYHRAQMFSLRELENAVMGFKIEVRVPSSNEATFIREIRRVTGAKTLQEAQAIERVLEKTYEKYKEERISKTTLMKIYDSAEQGASLQELDAKYHVLRDGFEIMVEQAVPRLQLWQKIPLMVAAKTWEEAQEMEQLLLLMRGRYYKGLLPEKQLLEFYDRVEQGATLEEIRTAAGIKPDGSAQVRIGERYLKTPQTYSLEEVRKIEDVLGGLNENIQSLKDKYIMLDNIWDGWADWPDNMRIILRFRAHIRSKEVKREITAIRKKYSQLVKAIERDCTFNYEDGTVIAFGAKTPKEADMMRLFLEREYKTIEGTKNIIADYGDTKALAKEKKASQKTLKRQQKLYAELRRAIEEGKSIEEVTKIYDKFGH